MIYDYNKTISNNDDKLGCIMLVGVIIGLGVGEGEGVFRYPPQGVTVSGPT